MAHLSDLNTGSSVSIHIFFFKDEYIRLHGPPNLIANYFVYCHLVYYVLSSPYCTYSDNCARWQNFKSSIKNKQYFAFLLSGSLLFPGEHDRILFLA